MRVLPDAHPGVPDDRSATRYLTWLVRTAWVPVAAAIVFAVVWMVCQALVPAVVGRAIDAGLIDRDGRALLIWSLVLAGVGVLQAAAGISRHRFDFSFSGLKTAVARWVEARERSGEPVPVADVAASFQDAVCDVLTAKALDACRANGVDTLIIGGGVAANSRLRALAEERAAKVGVRVRVPRPKLCTDNGAMVAALGSHLVAAGVAPSRLDLPADSAMPLTLVSV